MKSTANASQPHLTSIFQKVEQQIELPKREYKEVIKQIRTQLLELQFQAQELDIPVIILIGGLDGAGRGDALNLMMEFLDPRYINIHNLWSPTDEEQQRPLYWKYWRAMPAKGEIGVFFHGWYRDPLHDYAEGRLPQPDFERKMRYVARLEKMLVDDGALVMKFWFHLTSEAQKERVKEHKKNPGSGFIVTSEEVERVKHYNQIVTAAARGIAITNTTEAPWFLIDAYEWRYRNVQFLGSLAEGLEEAIARASTPPVTSPSRTLSLGHFPNTASILDSVDLSASLDNRDYQKVLKKQQHRLGKIAWKALEEGVSSIAVFEGWDAAGKGGTIRRMVHALDARLFKVISTSGPTDEEKRHHYLWRFWRHVPRAGFVTIYDRSWYGRVLVERVEGFASTDEWERAYQEINDFEYQLARHGIVVVKFWMHISKDEQLRRFEERQATPWKQHKITDEDWRNREKWDSYQRAVDDMVARTSTTLAPWHILPANSKKLARVEAIRHFVDAIEMRLKGELKT
ncbi:polyphosphate:AMP phosphotransferase [Desulfurispira natronophila]|uniref:Polyphosphate:AMP phosphotransferase n=1 Tax=Desulfurispira natronophila TaxID=682562 RepID=A0A7W7Y5K2_9BACT|nr:polyphosphate:AMP phosphotransferase [Desulfurispira natronophila]MBB5022212.1 polyphosphate:AMP phosphotransferase [Desulfurispira natronophila]